MSNTQTEVSEEIKTILTMLTYKRPAYSFTEQVFIDRFIKPIAEHPNVTKYVEDEFGNIFVEVCGGSHHLFTCHTDTVHSSEYEGKGPKMKVKVETKPRIQVVDYDPFLNIAYKSDGDPLGADDGVGVWLCLEMIKAGVPSWVAFFQAEEIGGIGSGDAVDSNPEFFRHFDSALAFDRRGDSDVITHQRGGRCASDEWAQALSDQLNSTDSALTYKPCSGGVFTDTANLMDIIPESSNISVGYGSEHTPSETQDIEHLLRLRDSLVKVDWAALPIRRDPAKKEEPRASATFGFAPMYWMDDEDTITFDPETGYTHLSTLTETDLATMTPSEVYDLCYEQPDLVSEFLIDYFLGQ